MSEWLRIWVVLLLVMVGLGSGCCRECEAPGAKCCPAKAAAVEPAAAEAPQPSAESDKSDPSAAPAKRPGGVSEAAWNMPAGIDRSRQVRLELMEKQLGELSAQMSSSATALMGAERQARSADPELGRLYDELVKGRMAYRKALEGSAAYADARKQNEEAMAAYRELALKLDDLKKEISQ